MASLSSWLGGHPEATLFIVAGIVVMILCASGFLAVRALMKPKANRKPRASIAILTGPGFKAGPPVDAPRQRTPFNWPPYRNSYGPPPRKKPATEEIVRRLADEAEVASQGASDQDRQMGSLRRRGAG